MSNQQPEIQPLKPAPKDSDSLPDRDRPLSTVLLNLHIGDLTMLHQLTFNNLPRFMLAAGFCLISVATSQLVQATETNLNRNSDRADQVTPSGLTTAGLNQKLSQKIRLEGSLLALKIKRSDV